MNRLFQRIKLYIAFALFVLSGSLTITAQAEEDFTSGFTQTEYTEGDGFESGEANCICQSVSGYIWIGTDSGLYRYDGSEFVLYSLDGENDGSIFSINCILTTMSGNLYVGTENYGLFYYENGGFTRVMDTYNLGIATINDMCEDDDGNIWLATATGIYMLGSDDITAYEESDMSDDDVTAISSFENNIYAIANNDTLITIKAGEVVSYENKAGYVTDDLNCLYIDDNGVRYYGTVGHSILKIQPDSSYEIVGTGALSGINGIYGDGEKIWVLADDGIAYFNEANEFSYASGIELNDCMCDMLVDYEGNYWFASYRKGLLLLERSKFINYTGKFDLSGSIVNCITSYNNQIYIGTDDGLTIIDRSGNKVLESDLVTQLSGVSIRQFYVDAHNNLWICTYKIYGVIKLYSSGQYVNYNRTESGLISNSVNCITELNDGSMAIGTESGISILNDGKVSKNYTRQDGMTNANIISLCQDETGILYAGSNGSGMYSIDMSANVKQISQEAGLNSNIVASIVKGTNGLWIGTDNGLYYQEGVIRQISSIDSSNSISDIIIDSEGYLWMFSSRGIQKYYENDLLSAAVPEGESYTRNDGLSSPITDNANNYISKDGIVYICCEEGLFILDTNNIYENEIPPKIKISSITVDGTEYPFSDFDGEIKLSQNVSRITIKFSVLSYVNRNNIVVQYYLDGFENEERTLSGTDTMEVEYTNLEGGTYQFVLSASNSDGIPCEQSVSLTIEKELKLFENPIAKELFILILIIILIVALFIARIIFRSIRKQSERVEELSKQNEIVEKSNQAKNSYVNYLGNEIRAPLNQVLANLEMMLRNTDEQNQEQINQLSEIYESGYLILGLVDGLSRLSRLKDREIDLEEKEYAVSDMIADLSPVLKEKVNRDLVQIKVSIEDDIPNGLIGDAVRVKEIITAIYDRAVATTKEGSISIYVNWHKAETEAEENLDEIYLEFVIQDTGIGIREERLSNLFELDDDYDKDDIGKFDIRISLAIAKELIEMMDGTVSVDSVYGAGTTISFSIKQKVFDYAYVNYNSERRKELVFRDSNFRIWLPEVNILLVDDTEATLQVEKTLLDTYGLTVDTAVSGFEAIDKVMVGQYDMVFMDTVMPVMDGADTVREIRDLDGEEYNRLPIIAMAENIVDGSRDEILSQGYDDVLVKPIEVDELEAMFKLYLPEEKLQEKSNEVDHYADEERYRKAIGLFAPQVNVENAVKMMGGNLEAFDKVIISYKLEHQADVDRLEDYLESDVRKFRNVIHDIKSNSGNICAFAIERKAANLESAINIGNMQYARENIKTFKSLIHQLFGKIEKYISIINDEPENSAEREFRDSINRAKLKEMRAYLKEADIKPVEELVADIDRYDYSDIDMEFLNALKMTIRSMDYEGASEIIDQYLNSK